jgi:hypothetical protein
MNRHIAVTFSERSCVLAGSREVKRLQVLRVLLVSLFLVTMFALLLDDDQATLFGAIVEVLVVSSREATLLGAIVEVLIVSRREATLFGAIVGVLVVSGREVMRDVIFLRECKTILHRLL